MTQGSKTGHAAALAAAIAVLLAAPAVAGGNPDRSKLDLNGDGNIDLAEIQTAKPDFTVEQFNAADANHDGQLSENEWRGGHRKRHLGNLDSDKDGNYTLQELQSAHPDLTQEKYDAFDGDRDGRVTQDEVRESVGNKLFDNIDSDRDGGVSLSEMQAVRSSVTPEKFARMDKDGDGQLSKDELRSSHKKHRRGDGAQQKPVEPPSGG